MAISDFAKKYREETGYVSPFLETDPELMERFCNFAFDEVIHMPLPEGVKPIDGRTRFMGILATLLGCQGIDEFRIMLPAALRMGVTPVEVKEIVYQAIAYLGIGRVSPFLTAINEIFAEQGIPLPLEGQANTIMENRREAGTAEQVKIFGDGMKDFWQSGPEDVRHINFYLAANCFGDYYTRSGLDAKEREMITFCFISAQGGCEPQLISHAKGNMNVGNDKNFLIQLVTQCLPYIGYPRTLNALSAIEKAAE